MKTIEWVNGKLRIIDQTRLPSAAVYLDLTDVAGVVEAIKSLRIRGAPALGVMAAYGLCIGAAKIKASDKASFTKQLDKVSAAILASRPTAVNIRWALDHMRIVAAKAKTPADTVDALLDEAKRMHYQDVAINKRMGKFGADLIPDGATVLTHCNTGSLATADFGTALGVIRSAVAQGKKIQVIATETRPLLQGARLTAWELMQDGIPATLITDSMAGHFMSKGAITCAIVGADRITANGDTANKIGTYSLAVLAHEHNIPFYIAAPISTIDPTLKTGASIPIEERKSEEVLGFGGVQTAPKGMRVANPAFDVTPSKYIAAIVTERGVLRKPYTQAIAKALKPTER